MSDDSFGRLPPDGYATEPGEASRGHSWLPYLFAMAAAVAIFLSAFFAASWLVSDSDRPADRAVQSPPESADATPALAAIDTAALTRGGDGSAGAILAGPGIVSSVANPTSYEILIPRAEVRASVVGLGLAPGGALGAPDNPDVVGWWTDGVAPGQTGNVLLDGHVDYTDIQGRVGLGVAWLVKDVVAGDTIVIRNMAADEAYVYRVTESLTVAADDPTAIRFLDPSADAMLTFVTCEGSFDSASFSYADRRIVRAVLESTVPLDDLPVF